VLEPGFAQLTLRFLSVHFQRLKLKCDDCFRTLLSNFNVLRLFTEGVQGVKVKVKSEAGAGDEERPSGDDLLANGRALHSFSFSAQLPAFVE
jgi:hypothetical protein